MTRETVEPMEWLSKRLREDHPDFVREALRTFVESLMHADAQARCGAEYGDVDPERTNYRNGYRQRPWDTRAGTISLQVPRLRKGSYFPSWLLQPRRRAEAALESVVAQAYLAGVSTRRVEGLVQTMGLDGISKSQVSEMAKHLDETVEEFRNWPLTGAPYRYLWIDALVQKCREGGRVVNVATMVATGVNKDGHREILGVDVVTNEDGTGWLGFLRSLVARGLSGVLLAVSDAHHGLVDALRATLPGASWQRCRAHFMRNLLTRVPKATQDFVGTVVRSVFAQPDAASVRECYERVVEQLRPKFGAASALLEEAGPDILAFASFPKEHWKQIWSNNPQERLNKEIRRRTDVVGIFPNRDAVIRLVGAVLAEQDDEWAIARRYMPAESLAKLDVRPEPIAQLVAKVTKEVKRLPKAA